MKLIFLGDSITRGTYTAKADQAPLSMADPNFADLVSRKLSASKYINYGINGISYSATSPVNPQDALVHLCQRVENFDMAFLAAGTNDYGTDVEIGKETDTEDISFYGAVRKTLSVLRKKEPDARLAVILPIPRRNEDKLNKRGYRLQDYRNALATVAAKYDCLVIHGEQLPIDPDAPQDKERYIYDGTHLNAAGHVLYADLIVCAIRKWEEQHGRKGL